MASWIKLQVTLPESPKVFRLARLLGVGRMEALGYAVRWFCWLDSHCANGSTELTEEEVDALIGKCGITRAFCELEWTVVDAAGYVLVLEFDKHNGECAKKRAETQSRVALHRERQRVEDSCNAKSVTLALPDKIRVGNNKEGAGIARADRGENAPEPAPTPDVNDEVFRGWLAALCAAHPSASRSLYLAPDVLKAAKDAFVRCPKACELSELLAAYFADGRLAENRFYAPRGQRKYFEDLEDVLAHAERWRRWSGWGSRQKAAARASGRQKRATVVPDAVSSEEAAAEFAAMRRELRP